MKDHLVAGFPAQGFLFSRHEAKNLRCSIFPCFFLSVPWDWQRWEGAVALVSLVTH